MGLKNMKFNWEYKVAVIGSSEEQYKEEEKERLYPLCNKIGNLFAEHEIITCSGGEKGVTEEIIKGANQNNGLTASFLPGYEYTHEHSKVTFPILTGMGYGMREIIMLRSADLVVGIGGGAGTLSELANAYNLRKPILALKGGGGWAEKFGNTYIDYRKKNKIIMVNDEIELMNKVKKILIMMKKLS